MVKNNCFFYKKKKYLQFYTHNPLWVVLYTTGTARTKQKQDLLVWHRWMKGAAVAESQMSPPIHFFLVIWLAESWSEEDGMI